MVLKKNKKLIKTFNCNFLYKKLLGLLIKCGFKSKAKLSLDLALFNVARKLNSSPKIILLNIFLKLNTFVEVKKVKSRKRLILVPFYVSYTRRLFLISKWLILAAKTNTRKLSFQEKLTSEILSLLTLKKSKSMLFKRINIKQALKSRSNIHYRW